MGSSVDKNDSRDISDVIEDLSGNAGVKTDALPAGIAESRKAIEAELPQGFRSASNDEMKNRPRLPPGAKPIVLPTGARISKDLLERCIKVGLFPIPPPGGKLIDVIVEEDHAAAIEQQQKSLKLLEQNKERIASMTAMGGSNKGLQMPIAGHMPFGVPSVEQHGPFCMAVCCADKNRKNFEEGYLGYLVPPFPEDADVKSSWEEGEYSNIMRQTIRDSTEVASARMCVHAFVASIGMISLYFCTSWFVISIPAVYNLLFPSVILMALAVYYWVIIRRRIVGFACPQDLLDKDLNKKCALITGGCTGLGAQYVKQFYKMGISKIMIADRSYMSGINSLNTIKTELRNEGYSTEDWTTVIEVIKCDLEDPTSISNFTEGILKRNIQINYLVLSAGVLEVDADHDTASTKDGKVLDKHFIVNYLAHLLIIRQLLFPIKLSGCRILLTTSSYYALAPHVDMQSYPFNAHELAEYKGKWGGFLKYCSANAQLILLCKVLQNRLFSTPPPNSGHSEATNLNGGAYAYNPGLCTSTRLVQSIKQSGLLPKVLIPLLGAFSKTPLESIQTGLYCLFASKDVLKGGGYYSEGVFTKTQALCNVTRKQTLTNVHLLWSQSNVMIGTYPPKHQPRPTPARAPSGQFPGNKSPPRIPLENLSDASKAQLLADVTQKVEAGTMKPDALAKLKEAIEKSSGAASVVPSTTEASTDVVEENSKDVVEENSKDVVEENSKDVVEEKSKDVVEENSEEANEEVAEAESS